MFGWFVKDDANRILFNQVFTVGAIGMHLFFSQFVFVILNTRHSIQELKERLGAQVIAH
jgi:hypothetical protein